MSPKAVYAMSTTEQKDQLGWPGEAEEYKKKQD